MTEHLNPSKRKQDTEEEQTIRRLEESVKFLTKQVLEEKLLQTKWQEEAWKLEKKKNEWCMGFFFLFILVIILILFQLFKIVV
jgi:hypothetical protein